MAQSGRGPCSCSRPTLLFPLTELRRSRQLAGCSDALWPCLGQEPAARQDLSQKECSHQREPSLASCDSVYWGHDQVGAHASETGIYSSRNERFLPIFAQRGPKTVSSYSAPARLTFCENFPSARPKFVEDTIRYSTLGSRRD